jgi:SWI/SNF related-matrix-associated actin-dependent regulator of chromatin subfamily C
LARSWTSFCNLQPSNYVYIDESNIFLLLLIDVAMTEAPADDSSAVKVKQDNDGSTAISDNPADAPSAPLADGDAADKGAENGTGTPKPDGEAAEGDGTLSKSQIESTARSHLIQQTHSIVIPSYSAWFDMHVINPIEKKMLPEFFNNRNRSKTPAVYKDYRDFMVNTYRLNPTEYLTVTACRRNLAGDVCAIMRVHNFLEQWGLINYQIDPETRPSVVGPPFTGHFRVVADTPRGLRPFQPGQNSKVTEGKPLAATERATAQRETPKAELNLEVRRNIFDSNGKPVSTSPKPTTEEQTNGEEAAANTNGTAAEDEAAANGADQKEPKKQFFCYSCGVDCTRVRYHSVKSAPAGQASAAAAKTKYDLCPNCFLEGRFPSSSSTADFVKLEDAGYSQGPDRDTPWTDAETLLLLEALELFDDNWNSVADHVGTRTREECVLKFLQLEIEDKYVEKELGAIGQNGNLNGFSGPAPYNATDNPVLSVMSFLAGLADQNVAAAAAGNASKEIKKSIEAKLNKEDSSAITTSKGKEVDGAAPSSAEQADSMDVDSSELVKATSLPPKDSSLKSLATIPLAAAAARAGALASHEEREMTRLVSSAVNITLQKIEAKLQHFTDLEAILQAERRELERGRQQLFLDRLALKKRVQEVEDLMKELHVDASNGTVDGAAPTQDAVDQIGAIGKQGFGAGRMEFTGTGEGAIQAPSAGGVADVAFHEL